MPDHKLNGSTDVPPSSILYQNLSKTTIVIDIPLSIAHAAHVQGQSGTLRELYSIEPLEKPFASTEPKSEKAKKNVAARNGVDSVNAGRYATLIEEALEEVKKGLRSEGPGARNWFHRRRVREDYDGEKARGRKRKRDDLEELGDGNVENSANEYTMTDSATAPNDDDDHHHSHQHQITCEPVPSMGLFSLEEERMHGLMRAVQNSERPQVKLLSKYPSHAGQAWNEQPSDMDTNPGSVVWHNPQPQTIFLTITEKEPDSSSASSNPIMFYLPPQSTSILSDCTDPSYLRTTIRQHRNQFKDRPTFDFILLDPPWPNTSAKRKSSYSTASQLRDLKRMILNMDLDTYIAPSGYVGIWITNAPTIRNLVLGEGGLFEAWNVTLVEEWIWVKVTRYGEPVTSLNGVWRKPYEVLLLGRAPVNRLAVAGEVEEERVVSRVIFGCPDLHSRKPCLKGLIEGLQMVKVGGNVLEIFARYLVAGWWSWGDEVLKFNWERYWTNDGSEDDDGLNIENFRRTGKSCGMS